MNLGLFSILDDSQEMFCDFPHLYKGHSLHCHMHIMIHNLKCFMLMMLTVSYNYALHRGSHLGIS